MGFIKFVFVILILVPVAIVMLFLINRLLNDYSESRRNEYRETTEERARRKGKKPDVHNRQQHTYDRNSYYENTYFKREENVIRESTMKGNPSYEAYKKARLKKEEVSQTRSVATNNRKLKKSRKVRRKNRKD